MQIQESLDYLRRLERHYSGAPEGARVKVLRLLKEDSSRTLGSAASLAGCSERSIYRWWNLYQERGIDAILGSKQATDAKNGKIGRDEILELEAQLRSGALSTLNEIQEWLEKRFGLQYSLKGVANLLQRRLKAKRVWIVPEGNELRPNEIKSVKMPADPTRIPDKLLHFLNRLPLVSDMQTALDIYREALAELLGDVDRVSLFVDIRCDITAEARPIGTPKLMITVDPTVGRDGISVTSRQDGQHPSHLILENMRTQGVKLEEYHPPVVSDYYYKSAEWLGAVFLWRDRVKTQISEQTRDLFAILEPFIIYMLSDIVARYHYAHPEDRLFHDALDAMMHDGGLTVQERRVVTYRLLGHAYKEIADKLNISEDAIKKHLGSVHRKTGTRSYTELFAKYFTPRLNIKDA